ncbi:MAG: SRPBCC family protein, partial [Acidimicrobiales bacterium]
MVEGSASVVIERPVAEVFAAVTDATRMGEWSPECVCGRWIQPTAAAAIGAKFEGDNVVKMGPVTLKKWTTTCEITEFVPDKVFEFVAADFTTWRYEFEDRDGATSVTESFSHE